MRTAVRLLLDFCLVWAVQEGYSAFHMRRHYADGGVASGVIVPGLLAALLLLLLGVLANRVPVLRLTGGLSALTALLAVLIHAGLQLIASLSGRGMIVGKEVVLFLADGVSALALGLLCLLARFALRMR